MKEKTISFTKTVNSNPEVKNKNQEVDIARIDSAASAQERALRAGHFKNNEFTKWK